MKSRNLWKSKKKKEIKWHLSSLNSYFSKTKERDTSSLRPAFKYIKLEPLPQ